MTRPLHRFVGVLLTGGLLLLSYIAFLAVNGLQRAELQKAYAVVMQTLLHHIIQVMVLVQVQQPQLNRQVRQLSTTVHCRICFASPDINKLILKFLHVFTLRIRFRVENFHFLDESMLSKSHI